MDQLCRKCTDGASSMVGSKKRFTALAKENEDYIHTLLFTSRKSSC